MSIISVIVPVYKVEPYLRRCVDSILAQTFTDFELILVDDGSPDNCGAICDEYARKDSRVHVIHQANGGLSAARNAGIDWVFAHSDSEWLTFVDSDDWVHEQLIEQLYTAVKKYDVKISIAHYAETAGDNPPWDANSIGIDLWDTEQFYLKWTVNATVSWGKLYNRECFFDLRYPRNRLHEDEFITYQILFKYKELAVVSASLYAYYQNEGGITKSGWTKQRIDQLDAVKEQLIYFKQNGYKQLYYERVKKYAVFIGDQYCRANNAESIDKHTINVLRMRLKKVLIEERKNIGFVEHNYWLYEIAFPKSMQVYWLYRALKTKIDNRSFLSK